MNDPVRWLDDSNVAQSVRGVLAAAGPVPPMPQAVHASLVAQCAALTASGVATQAAAGSAWAKLVSASIAGNTVKALVVASLVGAAGTTGYYVFREPAHSTSALHLSAHQTSQVHPAPREIPVPPAVAASVAEAADELKAPAASSDPRALQWRTKPKKRTCMVNCRQSNQYRVLPSPRLRHSTTRASPMRRNYWKMLAQRSPATRRGPCKSPSATRNCIRRGN